MNLTVQGTQLMTFGDKPCEHVQFANVGARDSQISLYPPGLSPWAALKSAEAAARSHPFPPNQCPAGRPRNRADKKCEFIVEKTAVTVEQLRNYWIQVTTLHGDPALSVSEEEFIDSLPLYFHQAGIQCDKKLVHGVTKVVAQLRARPLDPDAPTFKHSSDPAIEANIQMLTFGADSEFESEEEELLRSVGVRMRRGQAFLVLFIQNTDYLIMNFAHDLHKVTLRLGYTPRVVESPEDAFLELVATYFYFKLIDKMRIEAASVPLREHLRVTAFRQFTGRVERAYQARVGAQAAQQLLEEIEREAEAARKKGEKGTGAGAAVKKGGAGGKRDRAKQKGSRAQGKEAAPAGALDGDESESNLDQKSEEEKRSAIRIRTPEVVVPPAPSDSRGSSASGEAPDLCPDGWEEVGAAKARRLHSPIPSNLTEPAESESKGAGKVRRGRPPKNVRGLLPAGLVATAAATAATPFVPSAQDFPPLGAAATAAAATRTHAQAVTTGAQPAPPPAPPAPRARPSPPGSSRWSPIPPTTVNAKLPPPPPPPQASGHVQGGSPAAPPFIPPPQQASRPVPGPLSLLLSGSYLTSSAGLWASPAPPLLSSGLPYNPFLMAHSSPGPAGGMSTLFSRAPSGPSSAVPVKGAEAAAESELSLSKLLAQCRAASAKFLGFAVQA